MTSTASLPEGGYLTHFLASTTVVLKGGVIPSGRVMNHGDELVVTQEIRDLNTDRNGVTWLSLLDDPEGQVRRWGRQIIARGPWPEGKWLITDEGVVVAGASLAG